MRLIHGASMPATRALKEHVACPTLLTSVGYSSDVYTMIPLKLIVIKALPVKARPV